MTNRDFYSLVVEQLLPIEMPDYWVDYRANKITHFEALQKYFEAITAGESTVLRLLDQMTIDPNLKSSVARLEDHGWKIVVASAGCQWYIDKLLAEAGVSLEVYANPGRFQDGRGLLMELPKSSPFFSRIHGVHKAGIVQHFTKSGATVAFAGDGFPDIDAAKAVPPELRFARRDLATALRQDGDSFKTYHVWSDIADQLLEFSNP
jgi:2,3-diketo-5-methylthio-1-phosphopentane phosphatase